MQTAIVSAQSTYDDGDADLSELALAVSELGDALNLFKSKRITTGTYPIHTGTVNIPGDLSGYTINLADISGEISLRTNTGILPAGTIHTSIAGKEISIEIKSPVTLIDNKLVIKPYNTPGLDFFGTAFLAFNVGETGQAINADIVISGAADKTVGLYKNGKITALGSSAAGRDKLAHLTEGVVVVVYTPAAPSTNAMLSGLYVNGKLIANFKNTKYSYIQYLDAGTTVVPTITAVAENAGATVVVNQPTVFNNNTAAATITVTAQDRVTILTYKVQMNVKEAEIISPPGENINPDPPPGYSSPTVSVGSSNKGPNTPNSPYDPSVLPFVDVRIHWAKNDIESMYQKGIVSGVTETTFEPDRSITRAEFAVLIAKSLHLSGGQSTFKDVENGVWFAEYVNAVANAGMISGYDGYFRPNDLITREEMAVILGKSYEYLKLANPTLGSINKFKDKNQISDWAANYVDLVASAGLVKGKTEESFEPKQNATRAESTAVLRRLLDK